MLNRDRLSFPIACSRNMETCILHLSSFQQHKRIFPQNGRTVKRHTAEKVPAFGVNLILNLPHSDWIQANTSLRIQSKCGRMPTRIDTFHAVTLSAVSSLPWAWLPPHDTILVMEIKLLTRLNSGNNNYFKAIVWYRHISFSRQPVLTKLNLSSNLKKKSLHKTKQWHADVLPCLWCHQVWLFDNIQYVEKRKEHRKDTSGYKQFSLS